MTVETDLLGDKDNRSNRTYDDCVLLNNVYVDKAQQFMNGAPIMSLLPQ